MNYLFNLYFNAVPLKKPFDIINNFWQKIAWKFLTGSYEIGFSNGRGAGLISLLSARQIFPRTHDFETVWVDVLWDVENGLQF